MFFIQNMWLDFLGNKQSFKSFGTKFFLAQEHYLISDKRYKKSGKI